MPTLTYLAHSSPGTRSGRALEASGWRRRHSIASLRTGQTSRCRLSIHQSSQFAIKVYDPDTKETIWRIINVTNFHPGEDKRSSKSDQFTVTYESTPGTEFEESYSILGRFGDDLQISSEAPPSQVSRLPKVRREVSPTSGLTSRNLRVTSFIDSGRGSSLTE